ncbi:hypothetical protein D3C86_1933710 [compost metagenome]
MYRFAPQRTDQFLQPGFLVPFSAQDQAPFVSVCREAFRFMKCPDEHIEVFPLYEPARIQEVVAWQARFRFPALAQPELACEDFEQCVVVDAYILGA